MVEEMTVANETVSKNTKKTPFKEKMPLIPLGDLLVRSREIKARKDEKGYWLFGEDSNSTNKNKDVKPLQEGRNSFTKKFPGGSYSMKIIIDEEGFMAKLYKGKVLINAEIFEWKKNPKNPTKSDEKQVLITTQVLEWLKDFNLIKHE